jgi:hypothetical protein
MHLPKDDVVTHMLHLPWDSFHPKKESAGKVARKSQGAVHLPSKVIYG